MSKAHVLGGFIVVATVVGGYVGLQRSMDRVGPFAKRALESRGVEFNYARSARFTSGIGVTLDGVNAHSFSNSFAIKIDKVTASLEITPSMPPVRVVLRLTNPRIVPVNQRDTAGGIDVDWSNRGAALVIANAMLKITGVDVVVTGGQWIQAGAAEIVGTIRLRDLKANADGVERASLSHEFLFNQFSGTPVLARMLTNIHWTGESRLSRNALTARDQKIAAGPFVIAFNGSYDRSNGDWQTRFSIPQTSLSPASNAVNAQTLSWLRNIEGSVRVDLSLKGEEKKLVVEGGVAVKHLRGTIDSDEMRGEFNSDVDLKFTNNLPMGTARIDFTKMEIQQGDSFFKARGTPLVLNGEFQTVGNTLKVTQVAALMKNVKVLVSGEVSNQKPYIANLRAQLPSTSIKGWDEFFPKYSSMPMWGTLDGKVEFTGPLSNWKSGRLEAAFTGTKLRIPLLANWFSSKGLVVDGMTSLSTSSHVVYESREVRDVSSRTLMDLKDTEVSFRDKVEKSPGIPLNVDWWITGGKILTIKNALIKGFGGTLAFTGTVDVAGNPKARLQVRASSLNSAQVFSWFSDRAEGGKKMLSGKLSGEGAFAFNAKDADSAIDSLEGSGHASLIDGSFAPIQFMQKPNEVLSKIPELTRSISHAPGEEKLNQLSAKFTVSDQKFTLDDLNVQNPYFEVSGSDCTVRFDQSLSAALTWYPKSSLIPKEILSFIDSDKKKIGVPLKIAGTLWSPEIHADTSQFEARMKDLADGKFREQVEKRIQGGLGHTFQ